MVLTPRQLEGAATTVAHQVQAVEPKVQEVGFFRDLAERTAKKVSDLLFGPIGEGVDPNHRPQIFSRRGNWGKDKPLAQKAERFGGAATRDKGKDSIYMD